MFVVTDGINAGGGSRYSGSVATKITQYNTIPFFFFFFSFLNPEGEREARSPHRGGPCIYKILRRAPLGSLARQACSRL